MIIDGKAIALDIRDILLAEIRTRKELDIPMLYIIVAGGNAATKSFVALKKKYAAGLGIPVRERVFAAQSVTTETLLGAIQEVVASGMRGGIVVQLPLPPSVDTKAVLDAIPLRYDVDVLSEKAVRFFEEGESPVLPPVIGAFREILERHSVFLRGKRVAILGKGRLVGAQEALKLGMADRIATLEQTIQRFASGGRVSRRGAAACRRSCRGVVSSPRSGCACSG